MSVFSHSAPARRTSSRRLRFVMRLLFLGLFVLMAVAWFLVASLRLIHRDLGPYPELTVLYYATPGQVLCAGALLLSGWAWWGSHARGAASWCLIALIVPHCAGSDAGLARRAAETTSVFPFSDDAEAAGSDAAERTSAPTYRLVFWNTCHLRRGFWKVAEHLKQADADLIAIVEGGPPTEAMREVWEKHFPDYELTLLGGEMLLLIRNGQAGAVQARRLSQDGHLREIEVTLGDDSFLMMIADIYGKPDAPRQPALQDLALRLEQLQDRPVLIVGDFNTPIESLLFQPIHKFARNAFQQAGQGYSATWPVPLPVLAIDHVWGNNFLEFLDCQHAASAASDHRSICVEFQIQP